MRPHRLRAESIEDHSPPQRGAELPKRNLVEVKPIAVPKLHQAVKLGGDDRVYDDSGRTEQQMASVSVRYIVDDVAAAITFYCEQLDFHEVMHPAPTFAMLDRGELRLVLSAPSSQGGGGQAMPDGTKPEPGGWNRFIIEVADLADRVQVLRDRGVHFRNDIVDGVGGKQILLEDPAGNPIELFEPGIPEARLVHR